MAFHDVTLAACFTAGNQPLVVTRSGYDQMFSVTVASSTAAGWSRGKRPGEAVRGRLAGWEIDAQPIGDATVTLNHSDAAARVGQHRHPNRTGKGAVLVIAVLGPARPSPLRRPPVQHLRPTGAPPLVGGAAGNYGPAASAAGPLF